MAVNRVLTSDEREILQNSTRFISNCNWTIRNFALTWTDDTQTSTLVGAVGYNRWAVNRMYSAQILFNNGIETTIGTTFCELLKNVNLWDSAVSPFAVDTVINYMIANNLFDAQSQAYVTLKTKQYLF